MSRLYLDANASEPLRPAARAAMLAALDVAGNPSSVHAEGRMARKLLEEARGTVARHLQGRAQDVVFTSGATEANALALHALGRNRRVLVGATEHPAILQAVPEAPRLPVAMDGRLDLAALDAMLGAGPPSLVCLMAANNETGVLHPLMEAAGLCRRHGALLHVDAVQVLGRVAMDWAAIGADSIAISAHKIGGPKGVGALLVKPGADVAPLWRGGGQERGRRGGTEALPAIAGFAAALDDLNLEAARKLGALRDAIEQGAGAATAGRGAPRLPNTACLMLPGLKAETQVIALDLMGIAVSAGAACSSGKVAASATLQAMGLGEAAACAIRVSLPWNAPADAAEGFLAAYSQLHARLRR
ncbi:cysteine desulfurase family protein [Teichococcus oryzae]|uniref:Cysteine desulfurase n=1 Tax=Teichococcus oryzae TaxID=1608942 RepID=A0A5B2TLY9_9PROT|nr:aminotransferase class V-fold PLP-dependent enzyme [Pseudoroseomonas oryzae]KAA2215133.1 aminotransferase class V-fold PLP-dependent enzyme [Pseudoroseomonas oryzae]